MPFVPLKLKPGVNVEQSALLLEAGFVQSCNIRFFQGLVQCLGFFQRLSSTMVRGVCRGMFPWADTSGNYYIAEGTTSELAVYNNGNLYDITPVVDTSNLSNAFSTTTGVSSSTTVTVTDAANYAVAGNYINLVTPVSIANLLLSGPFLINSTGASTFTISSPVAATSATTGGNTALFNTTNTSSSVQVTLQNHGQVTGSSYTIQVSTSVGGLTLLGVYLVTGVTSTSVFHINAGTNASSTTSAYENSDQARVQYLLTTGLTSQGGVAGYGQMPYGQGPYGLGQNVDYLPLRQWFFGAWGSYLISSYTNGPIYVWMPSGGFYSNPATVISQAPAYNTCIFIAIDEQQIIALGAQDSVSGLQDPLLIRWCDVRDYTDWTATTTNQAGSYRIPVGSRIVGGFSVSLQNFVWTDLGLWAMQYIGYPYIYSVSQIASGCGLISARAMAILANAVIWMSQKGFFMYAGGSVTPIPCPIWDIIFNNLDTQQVDKITGAPNSSFTEMAWHLPSASGTGENDTTVKLNLTDGSWDYSNGSGAQIYVRTAAYDQSIIGPPMGVDLNGLIQQSETGFSGDGQPIISSVTTGWFRLQEGLETMSIEKILPDFVTYGVPNLTMTILTTNYSGDTPTEWGPFDCYDTNALSQVEYFIVRSRSRFAAIQINCTSNPPSGTAPGAFWRLGACLIKTFPAGRRP